MRIVQGELQPQSLFPLAPRFVASLDILGFKNAIREPGVLAIADNYSAAIYITTLHHEEKRELFHPGIHIIGQGPAKTGEVVYTYGHTLKPIIFSDSIFLLTIDDSEEALKELCELSVLIFRTFLEKRLMLRGGIARGETIVDLEKNMYLGQGIIDAHELEQRLDLVGIALQDGLTCSSSTQALITFKDKTQKELHVPIHRQVSRQEHLAQQFQFARHNAGSEFAGRYKNSEAIVAAMLQSDSAAFRKG